MTIPGDVGNSKRPSKFAVKRLMLLMIIVGAVIIFAVWLFFISGSYDTFDDINSYLPPNCYSLNGKQVCPNP